MEKHEEAIRFVVADAITQVKMMYPNENAIFCIAGAQAILEDALEFVKGASEDFSKFVKELEIPSRIEE